MKTLSTDSALLTKKFYPVIHCTDPFRQNGVDHALHNTRIAVENGADGVFLIGHGMQFPQLTRLYDHVRKDFPHTWIGINFLDLGARKIWVGLETVVMGCVGLNALWIDSLPEYRLALPSKIQLFGGVAFKYIAPNLSGDALISACTEAKRCVDIATTSGERTGSPPSIQKLASIRAALLGQMPVAVASGVSEENVCTLLPYVDMFLVASSICEKKVVGEKELDFLIPKKTRTLADLIHQTGK